MAIPISRGALPTPCLASFTAPYLPPLAHRQADGAMHHALRFGRRLPASMTFTALSLAFRRGDRPAFARASAAALMPYASKLLCHYPHSYLI